ncbi:MAG: ImmA/IrrE family metallo-endopeptidase [Actinomycetia bacterium]|nr:ImmA/IrrE family metallo-endopeptidase [Actinomycetes bacterium]
MIQWAVERSGRSAEELGKFPISAWMTDAKQPTMRQLEEFAKATYTPIGMLFLTEPPDEQVPLPDFRTFRAAGIRRATPNLLDTIYACEARQDWFREFAEANGAEPVALVGSLTLDTPPIEAALQLRDALGFGLDRRVEFSNWTQALSGLTEHAEEAGVLVMTNGVVGSNTHRPLDPEEFRGFALADEYAPVVFVNGADYKAAQIFTLAHELAHIALGGSAVSKPDLGQLDDDDRTEGWCNAVAAELLVPQDSLRNAYIPDRDITEELDRLAKFYKASTLVVLRRIADAGLMSRDVFRREYRGEMERVQRLAGDRKPGGSFYNTTPVRVSKRFARALISDTLEGRTSHRRAFRLLGSKRLSAFEELGNRLGVA